MSLRILMISPRYYPYSGGLESQAHTLSKELVRQGLEITVVTGMYEFKLPSTEEIEGVMIHRLISSRTPLLRGVSLMPLLCRFLTCHAHKYDVIHLHAFGWYLLSVIPIVKKLGKPTLLKLPNVGEYGLVGIQKRKTGSMLMRLIKSADAFVAMSEDSEKELLQEGIRSSRIFSVNNGVDTSIFHVVSSEIEKAKLRESLRLPNGMLCLFTGSLSKKKGVTDLLAVWPEITEKIPSAHLILCGSGPLESNLHDLVQSYGIKRTVHFRGYVKNIDSYYRASDLFVLPSYFEGNSNAVLEAMASGLPIVSTLTGGTSLLVGNIGKDYLIEPGDRVALLNVLSKLLSSKAEMQKLSVGHVQRASNYFAIERIAVNYCKCYKLLASKRFDAVGELKSPIEP